MTDIHELSPLFERIKSRFEKSRMAETGLQCKQGFYKNCQVVKLLKPFWTNDRPDQVENETGIFFSVWINAKNPGDNRAHYNIHALKLRKLNGFSIASREFALAFRNGFATSASEWPNVSMQYGPQTLMQGWSEVGHNTERDLLLLLQRFEPIGGLIDRLLESRRR